jgi:hypothetical protein
MTESTEDRERDALDWLSKGTAFLEAADGPGSGKLNLLVRHQVTPELSLPPSELRRTALYCFLQASGLIPDEPWIWFQMGWNLVAYLEEASDRQAALGGARGFLERVLELRPHDPIAHVALAWLLYQDAMKEERADPEWAQVLWQGEVGEHLREALDRKRGAEAAYDGMWRKFAVDWVEAPWFPTRAGAVAMIRALEQMDDLIPAEYRFAYCLLYSQYVEGPALQLRWLEEVLRWPTDDNVTAARVNLRLGSLMQREGGPLEKAFKHFWAAGRYLLKLTEEERDSLGSGYRRDRVEMEWLLEFPGASPDSPPDELPLFLELIEVALRLAQSYTEYEDDYLVLESIAGKAAIAGHILLVLNDKRRAKHYLALAKDLEKRLIECGSYIPTEDDEFIDRGPSYWRVVAARARRDISIGERDFSAAREENCRILDLLPRDRDALHCSIELEQLNRSDSHHLEELAQLSSLHDMTRSVLAEVVLQQGALEQLADLRRDVEEIAKSRTLGVSDMNALVEQLHDIAQHQTRISPAALHRARQRLVAELGEVTFGALLPESQHFLTTAEVLFSASEDLAELIDSGSIVVEYAKVVEVELRNRFLPDLARLLRKIDFQGELYIGNKIFEYRGPYTWSKLLPGFSLGQAALLLNEAMAGSQNAIVRTILEGLEPCAGWARVLAGDLDKLVNSYRNPGAHGNTPVDGTVLNELRELLLGAGLLRRIIELERAIPRN